MAKQFNVPPVFSPPVETISLLFQPSTPPPPSDLRDPRTPSRTPVPHSSSSTSTQPLHHLLSAAPQFSSTIGFGSAPPSSRITRRFWRSLILGSLSKNASLQTILTP